RGTASVTPSTTGRVRRSYANDTSTACRARKAVSATVAEYSKVASIGSFYVRLSVRVRKRDVSDPTIREEQHAKELDCHSTREARRERGGRDGRRIDDSR